MNKFIRKYQKQMLAVFGVLLMVVFIIPQAGKTGRTFSRHPIGHIGKQAVYAEEKAQAAADWTLLQRVGALMPFLPDRSSNQFSQPWMPRMGPYAAKLGLGLYNEIERNPDIYLLMQKEAAARGIVVSPDQVGTVMRNELYLQSYGHPTVEAMGADSFNALSETVGRFLPVLLLYEQIASDAKVTEPMWEHTLAESLQHAKLSLADFSASQFVSSVSPPNSEQLTAQYDQFKNRIAGEDHSADDALGFGYKLPQRVKIQYLKVSRKQVMDAVKASRKPYDWEVDERVYYYAHQQDFVRAAPKATTVPSTAPTTSPATNAVTKSTPAAPTTTPATTSVAVTAPAASQPAVAATEASSEPTTRPFSEVQPEIVEQVMQKPAAELTEKLLAALTTRLAADYQKQSGTTQPASQPPSQPPSQPATQA